MSAPKPPMITTSGARSTRRARWARLVGVGALASVLGLGTVTASPILPASFRIVAVDWQQPSGSSSSPWGQHQGGQDSSGNSSTNTVNSAPASTKQSTGVVLINTVLPDGEAAGTGIVLTANGEILTNYHVVEGSTAIKVTVASTGTVYTATVVGHDQIDDIALLQLSSASRLTTATIDDDIVSTGNEVTAVGNAGGTGTLTAATGTVTALRASITTESEGSTAGETLKSLIETDADVVPGDSGGPLLDAEGEVIGIDTAASSGTEIDGYAIPIERALTIVRTILSGDETITVTIGAKAYLGVEIAADAASSDASGGYGGGWGGDDAYSSDESSYQSSTGATVAGVVDQNPAADAGIVAGDTITAVAGDAITTGDALTTALAGHEPGDKITITWTDSSGTSHTATVTLGSNPLA